MLNKKRLAVNMKYYWRKYFTLVGNGRIQTVEGQQGKIDGYYLADAVKKMIEIARILEACGRDESYENGGCYKKLRIPTEAGR